MFPGVRYNRAQELGIPFMAGYAFWLHFNKKRRFQQEMLNLPFSIGIPGNQGKNDRSSVPMCFWRSDLEGNGWPACEHPLGVDLADALMISYGGLEAYGCLLRA